MNLRPPPPPDAPSAHPEDDESIPLLTEVVELPVSAPALAPPGADETTEPPRPGEAIAPTGTLALPPIPHPAPLESAQPDWPDIAMQVQSRVATRLADRCATLFDGELQSLIDPVVDRAIHQFSAQVEAALREVAADLVARAVADEMARVHDEIARGEFPPAPER